MNLYSEKRSITWLSTRFFFFFLFQSSRRSFTLVLFMFFAHSSSFILLSSGVILEYSENLSLPIVSTIFRCLIACAWWAYLHRNHEAKNDTGYTYFIRN